MKRLLGFVVGVCLLPLAAAEGKDKLWEITAQMEMPDMPPEMKGMKLPGFGSPQKHTVCLAEGKKYESDKQKDCKVLDQKQSGRITRMTIQCKEGTMKMEREELSKDHWKLKMDMVSDSGNMTMFEEAKRVGSCNAEQEGGMSRETQKVLGDAKAQSDATAAALGQECRQAVAAWPASAQAFAAYEQTATARKDALAKAKGNKEALKVTNAMYPDVPACAKAKTEYCGKSKAALREAGARSGYAAVMGRGQPAEVESALAYCGAKLAPLSARHCKAAVGDADYSFVAAYCPAERKELALQHCAGRAYTAVEPKYRALCGGGSGGEGDGVAAGAIDQGSAAVEQGVKKLKGLFGF
jgi:hypothetical protein